MDNVKRYRMVKIGQKYFTRAAAVEGINLADYILLAQDKAEASAHKLFYRMPITELNARFAAAISADNNLYEILPPDMPVKPYFDCELEAPELLHDDFIELCNDFVAWIVAEIWAVFGVKLYSSDIAVMDSCRTGKLSFHIVIQNKICFANVADHKVFIKYLMGRFAAPVDDAEIALFASLHWMFKGDQPRRIFDEAPYGSFQNFRLVNQSKKGKGYILTNCSDALDADTYVRLYYGPGDRVVADMDRIPVKADENRMRTIAAERKTGVRGVPPPVDFVTTGMTLMEKHKMTYQTLNRKIKPLWKRWLYLIPNSQQPYEFYRNIAFAVAGANGTRAEFEEWAALYSHYDSATCISVHFERFRKGGAGTLKHGFLRRHAKLAHPAFFDDGDVQLDEYFTPDYTGIPIIRETCPFLSMEGTEFEHDIDRPEKIVIMDAYMGRGKTVAIKRMIKNYPRILCLAPRMSYAKFMTIQIDGVVYIAGDYTADRLVCSMESLHKMPENTYYDFIIIDEVEANLATFSSETMHGKQLDNYRRLIALIERAQKVVMASAFITQKTTNFVRALGIPAYAIINDAPPRARRAIETKDFMTDFDAAVKKGKKIYGVFGSRNNMLAASTIFRRDEILTYHGRENDCVYDTLDNMDETWGEAKAVLVTPAVTVGNSYSPDRPPDFDQVWMLAMPTCICVDLFQAHMRVRHIKDNVLYFGLPPAQTLSLFANMSNIDFSTLAEFDTFTHERTLAVVNMLNSLIKSPGDTGVKIPKHIVQHALTSLTTGYSMTPAALREIHMHNVYEVALSRKYYKAMFMRFLVKCGYDVQTAPGDSASVNTSDRWDDLYTKLPIYNEDDVVRVRKLICAKRATSEEKMAVERYFYDKMIDLSAPIEYIVFNFSLYMSGCGRRNFLRGHMEMKGLGAALWSLGEIRPEGVEFQNRSAAKLQHIKILNDMLGIKHSWDSVIVPTERVVACTEYVTANQTQLRRCFGIQDRCNSTRKMTPGAVRAILDKIYSNWSGVTFRGALADGGITNGYGKIIDCGIFKQPADSPPRNWVLGHWPIRIHPPVANVVMDDLVDLGAPVAKPINYVTDNLVHTEKYKALVESWRVHNEIYRPTMRRVVPWTDTAAWIRDDVLKLVEAVLA